MTRSWCWRQVTILIDFKWVIKLFRLDQLHQEWEEKQDDWRCDAQHREAERQKSTRRRNTAIEFQDHHLKQVINNIGGNELDN